MGVGSGGNQITVDGFFSTSNTINEFTFDDGSVLTSETLFSAFGVTSPSNTISVGDAVLGDSDDNHLLGTIDGDTLIAGGGGDILEANEGNDLLIGGEGNDSYVIGLNSGRDTIVDVSGVNTIDFTDSIGFSDVASGFIKTGDDLLIAIGSGGDDEVKIKNFFTTANTIDAINMADGTQITSPELFDLFGLPVPTNNGSYNDVQLKGVGSTTTNKSDFPSMDEATSIGLAKANLSSLISVMSTFDIPEGAGSIEVYETSEDDRILLAGSSL